jgi:DEAD/DEAH box helicase domain-containing protein
MDKRTRTALAAPHALECDTSCNRCLREFQDLPYHGLLDWRLALDMARVLTSQGAVVDLSSPWGSVDNPWSSLLSGPQAPVPASLQRLGYAVSTPLRGLRIYVRDGVERKRVLIERHPLWQDDHPDYQSAVAAASLAHPGITPEPLNPFRLLRRPADYV